MAGIGTPVDGGAAGGAAMPPASPGAAAARMTGEAADQATVKAMLEAEGQATLVLALNGAVEGWNRAWESLAGIVPVAGSTTIFDLTPADAHAHWHGWLLRLVSGETVPVARTAVRRAGVEIPVEVSLLPVTLGGDRIVARVRFRDCTRETQAELAQRTSDERFRMLCALAPMGVFQTDAKGRLTYTNQRWRNLAGLHAVEEPRGLWWQAVHPEDRPKVLQQWESCLHHGSEFVAEFRFLVEQGRSRWGRTRIAQHAGSDGRVAYFIGTSEDITDLKRIEVELARARDAAMESARLKTQFLANVSHEIRTPMNGVLGMLELLAATDLTEAQQRYAGIARESAEVLMAVIEDILDFSSLDDGRMRLMTGPISLPEMLESVVRQFRPQAESHGLVLGGEVDPHVPPWVIGDAARLHQVLAKLVGNAIKFTPAGSVTVRCLMLSADAGRCLVRLEVQDTGIGIQKDDFTRIFEPFVQVDGELNRRHQGAGLGLSVAKQLVELMGAEISVDSTPGVGSTFWTDLTLVPCAADGRRLV